MEIILDCPFGSKCEEVKDNQVHRCRFYIQIRGKDPQSEEMVDKWDCAFALLPIIMIENAQTNRGQTQALESFRNEVVKNQKEFNSIFFSEINRRVDMEKLEEKVALLLLEKEREKLLIAQKEE